MEVPAEKIALCQKMIIEKCNRMGKIVITATQMLESMIENPLPTRAEMTDVANAVIDGTHAVMLSGETANGKFPDTAVRTMAAIAENAELAVDAAYQFDHIRRAPGEPAVAARAAAPAA
jgi:pyruvate kinase